jgi:hypothetical protein
VLGCADNPLNLAEGQWVRNKLDGQKYYITTLATDRNPDHGGYVRVKNEFGEEVDITFAIHDFEIWTEASEEINPENDLQLADLMVELHRAREALEAANTPQNRLSLEEAIEEVEEDLSPIFRNRKWNPKTNTYE